MVDHLTPEQLATFDTPAEASTDPAPTGDPTPAPAPEATGEPAGGEPAAPEATTPPAPAAPVDPWATYGGEDRVKDAIAISEALATDEGVEALVREGLAAMGLDAEAALALARGEEAPDPDEILTRAQLDERLRQERESFTSQLRKQQEVEARGAVEGALTELGVADDADARAMVLTYAQKHVSGPDETDPRKLIAAVQAGHADYERAMEAAAAAYVAKKAQTAQTVPSPLRGGGAPANETAP